MNKTNSHEIPEDTHTSDVFLLSRKSFLQMSLIAGLGLIIPSWAHADTQEDLDEAKARYKKAKKELEAIGDEVEEASRALAKTQSELEAVITQKATIQAQITQSETNIATRQDVLSKRVSKDYKLGPASLLGILFQSASFEELTSNLYYFGKISQSDQELIQAITEEKKELEKKNAELSVKQKELEQKQAEAKEKNEIVRQKQKKVEEKLDSLDSEVKELIKKRDEELAAAARAAEEERKRQELASLGAGVGGGISVSGNGSLARVLNAARAVGSPGAGLCAMWVSQVFYRAGLGYPGGNANDMYWAWCHSSDLSQLKPGMIVAVSTHPHDPMARIYGHIGIYMGNDVVLENVGYIASKTISQWQSFYGVTVPVRWGWIGGVGLT